MPSPITVRAARSPGKPELVPVPPFFRLPHDLMEDTTLSPADKMVLGAVKRGQHRGQPLCQPTDADLSVWSGCSVATVKRSLSRLVERGLVERETVRGMRGYRILIANLDPPTVKIHAQLVSATVDPLPDQADPPGDHIDSQKDQFEPSKDHPAPFKDQDEPPYIGSKKGFKKEERKEQDLSLSPPTPLTGGVERGEKMGEREKLNAPLREKKTPPEHYRHRIATQVAYVASLEAEGCHATKLRLERDVLALHRKEYAAAYPAESSGSPQAASPG